MIGVNNIREKKPDYSFNWASSFGRDEASSSSAAQVGRYNFLLNLRNDYIPLDSVFKKQMATDLGWKDYSSTYLQLDNQYASNTENSILRKRFDSEITFSSNIREAISMKYGYIAAYRNHSLTASVPNYIIPLGSLMIRKDHALELIKLHKSMIRSSDYKFHLDPTRTLFFYDEEKLRDRLTVQGMKNFRELINRMKCSGIGSIKISNFDEHIFIVNKLENKKTLSETKDLKKQFKEHVI